MKTIVFEDIPAISNWFLENLLDLSCKNDGKFNVALSGGNTPKSIYKTFCFSAKRHLIDWEKIHLWFVDERCVPPYNPESNYLMTEEHLLKNIDIPNNNIHRMQCEFIPETASEKYIQEIISNIPLKNNIPWFDWIVLGIGEDGHTASIFPNSRWIIDSGNYCEVTQNPYTNQYRVTLTPAVINNADIISILVTGKNKANILGKIFNIENNSEFYPAKLINPSNGLLEWILDKEASESLILS